MQGIRRALQDPRELAAATVPSQSVDSNVGIILGALLGALICVVGVALLARRAWLRRFPAQVAAAPPPPKGLDRHVLSSLPRQLFRKGAAAASDCPICLAEFVDGEEIRVLPFCGHRFHLHCVDLWLATNSSCPSCRDHLGAAASRYDF